MGQTTITPTATLPPSRSTIPIQSRETRSVNEVPVILRVPYEQWFVPPRCRTPRPEWFLDEGAVMIRVVQPEEAPVAYRVKSRPLPLYPEHGRDCDVRIFEGKFWWPLLHDNGRRFVEPAEFQRYAKEGLPLAVLAIDPSISVPTGRWPLILFDDGAARTVGESDKDLRWGYVQANRLRTAFCADKVLVEAGEPIFYAVPSRGGIEIEVGPSAWDRCGAYSAMGGPDRQQRREAARLGSAFGAGELDTALRSFSERGVGVHQNAELELLMSSSETGAAALLCGRALAEFIWQEAGREGFWTAALKNSVPAVAGAGAPFATAEDLVHRDVLEQISASRDPVILREFFREAQDARDILTRWKSLGISGFAAKDEVALALLAD